MAKYILYGITGIAWLVALVWVLVEPGFEPLLAFLAGCATLVGTFWLPKDESAGDDDGDGRREVHCNTCEGWGTALRTFLRAFRGVHKAYLACYVAMFEAIANAKRITPDLVRRMCYGKAICT